MDVGGDCKVFSGEGRATALLEQWTLGWWLIIEWALKFLKTMKTDRREQSLWLFMKLPSIYTFEAQDTELLPGICHRTNTYVKPSVPKTWSVPKEAILM